jgi:hypothetical protein
VERELSAMCVCCSVGAAPAQTNWVP